MGTWVQSFNYSAYAPPLLWWVVLSPAVGRSGPPHPVGSASGAPPLPFPSIRGPVGCVFHAHRAFNTTFENSCRRFAVINYI